MKRRVMFRFSDLIRLGLHGVIVHKVRSVLTVLGILFGVWGVIAMLAINAGLSEESQRALRQLGSTNIIIDATKPSGNSGQAGGRHGALNYGLTRADVERLKTNIPGVKQTESMVLLYRRVSPGFLGSPVVVASDAVTIKDGLNLTRETKTPSRPIEGFEFLRSHRHCNGGLGCRRRCFVLAFMTADTGESFARLKCRP